MPEHLEHEVEDSVEIVFGALADHTRRQILEAVAANGGVTATGLAAVLPVTRQAVVKHLAVLDRAGLVEGAKHGREVRYHVRPERLSATARWITVRAAAWDRRLAVIKQLAESGTDEPPVPGAEGATPD
ncbi:metalloregulator ArsR/SmtB family transcription factor [Lentzea sp. BCCO 10_0856]|uniref:Metalloregulator ArsR/SmtB family transcription factor n=1 Tax=Lentzea miocenica TaxID=3095431 RepID=A0ABU4T7J9_9PSEU|nr:metalloregulator ArsR/SmtB family transcription factor [Lentzea sp. BCCO 10_0856]MDX8034146.1 metalloregulator ArsR/SmtB family transcription factor [Lentzea sp. BCCO 10_0856]